MIGDFQHMRRAIERAWQVSEFHRSHWLAAGVKDGWIPSEPAALQELPVVTKEDLLEAQRTNPPWGGNLCIDQRSVAQVHLTTGTSGIGQERYALSAKDVDVMGRSWDRQYAAIGLEAGDAALMTIPVSFFCAGLSALEGARIHGLVPILSGLTSKELMLDLLAEHRVSYLYGVESLLLQLSNLAASKGYANKLRGTLKGVQSVGASEHLLRAADDVFGAKVFEVYGCTQAAAKIANTCHLGVAEGTNHFHGDYLFIETRDPVTGMLVEEGEAELIISTPFREACPVFRFAIRDKVMLVPPGGCACGDPRPGFKPGTLGRMDSMLKIRGVNLWPQQVEQLLLGHPGVLDFRAEVSRSDTGAEQLVLRVASIAGTAAADLSRSVEHLVRERTMVRPVVEIVSHLDEAVGAYKVKRWKDLRKPGETSHA